MEILLYGESETNDLKRQLEQSNRGPVSIEDYCSVFYWSIEKHLQTKNITTRSEKDYADALLQSTKKSFVFPEKVKDWPLWDMFLQKTISCRSKPLELYDPSSSRFMDSFVLGNFMKESSKLGLQMAIEDPKVKIWVSLDKVTITEVLRKEADWFPNLGPELRFMYRNWSDLSNKVIFFLHGEEVAAPWISNPNRWKEYDEQRKSKLQNLIRTHNPNSLSSEKQESSHSQAVTQKKGLQEKIINAKGNSSSRNSNTSRKVHIKVEEEKIIF
ncbi:hypothetical protein P7H50_14235 [Enterococcus durans]|uniref:hypothetical protein n=1 Tax=Enterococcus durans TaxID=53345 RepID=UPI00288CF518|nr:hypothetical protein [Enterococcus durans]MDT2838003.1 hypothetical protein [Enterococcus durans]